MTSRTKPFFSTFLCLLLVSCSQWELKKIPSKTLLAQKWKAISLEEVDVYPSFDFCDELASKEVLKACFENEVTSRLYTALSQHHFEIDRDVNDTIFIDLIVNEKGIYCIDSLKVPPTILLEIPRLERWIHDACEQLPKAHPARIQNIPVKTRFKIPLIFQTEAS